MFQQRPNIARLARRQNLDGLIIALTYEEWVDTQDGRRLDLGGSVRRDAARALGQTDAPLATRLLVDVAIHDVDPGVRRAAVEQLAGNLDPEIIAELVDAVCDWREPLYKPARGAALTALRQLPRETAPSLLARALIARSVSPQFSEDERRAVRELLAHDEQWADAATAVLIAALTPNGGPLAPRAADALVELAPWGARELIDALDEQSLSAMAAGVIGRRGDGHAVEALIRLLGQGDPGARTAAATALGELRDPLAAEPLLGAVNDDHHDVRVAAAAAIDKLASIEVIASVATMLRPMIEGRHDHGHPNRASKLNAEQLSLLQESPDPESPSPRGTAGSMPAGELKEGGGDATPTAPDANEEGTGTASSAAGRTDARGEHASDNRGEQNTPGPLQFSSEPFESRRDLNAPGRFFRAFSFRRSTY